MHLDEFNESKFKLKYIFIALGVIAVIGILVFVVILLKTANKYSLSLDGEETIKIYAGTDYVEPGYSCFDKKGNDVTDKVIVNNQINTQVPGEYEITYTVNKITKTRYITVTEKPIGATYIYLKGDLTIYLKMNEEYKEPGYIVIDTVDSNLSNQVKINNTINSKKTGTYRIVYSVVNSSGVTTSAARTIIVVGSEISLSLNPTTPTNGSVNINVSVIDNYFDYMILPNNTKVSSSTYTYKVTENGTYTFKAYNKKGATKSSSIKVNNIDKTAPNGSCSGSYSNGSSTIVINATDNIGIKKYVVDGQTFSSNQITIKKELSVANVAIYDLAGNSKNISCSLTNKNVIHYDHVFKPLSFTASNNISFSYWLYVPEGATDKMPLIGYIHGLGDDGNDYKNNTDRGIRCGPGNDIKDHQQSYNAIIVMPQCPVSGCWTGSNKYLHAVYELLNIIADKYKVNKSKISFSGFSNGCYGALTIVELYPGYFSAVVPVGCDVSGRDASKFTHLAVWTLDGKSKGSREPFVNKINELGGNAVNTFVEKHVHNIANDTYSIYRDNNYNIIYWMTQQTKK